MPDLPRLDWRSRHDQRSRGYAVADVLVGRVPVLKKCWRPGPVLDQGVDGACVGFAWAAELAASPARVHAADNVFARRLYREAQHHDPWPDDQPYEGTSVLAGAKTAQSWGWIGSYRWAFTIEDLRDAVVALGPAVIGIPWLESMREPRPSGLLEVHGQPVGGHAICVTGYHPHMRINGEGYHTRHEVFTLRNSWGPHWGKNGNALIRAGDLAQLLADHGEACIPLARTTRGGRT